MGQFEFKGPKAIPALQKLVTNDIAKLEVGKAAYAGLLNPRGGFVDDVFVYKLGAEHLIMVVNASNIDKDFAWVQQNTEPGVATNRSDDFALLAVQGPKALEVVQKLTSAELGSMTKNSIRPGAVAGAEGFIARSGYTGEDGFELFLKPADGEKVWNAVLEAGKAVDLIPCGLGARDTLRLEVKNALYGNDIDDDHTPLEAGLGWIVKMDKGDFIGRAPLEAQKAAGIQRKLVGFETEKVPPRHGYAILKDGQKVGEVTSGTVAPSLKRPIGMGYVPVSLSTEGSTFDVEIRGKPVPARVVKTPFYKRS
jgi:aminomethyltransferase